MSHEQLIHYPDAGQPLLRVEISPAASIEQAAMCAAYWAFAEPGTWASAVKDVGTQGRVLATVRAYSRAYLLSVLCPTCRNPSLVASRGAVAALRKGRHALWSPGHPDRFPTEPLMLGRCGACREGFTKAARTRQLRAAAMRYCEETVHDFGVDLTTRAYVVAIRLSEIIGFDGSLQPLSSLDYTFLGDAKTDNPVFEELWHAGWIAVDPSSPLAAFSVDDEDAIDGIYVPDVQWTLAPGLADNFTVPGESPPTDLRSLLGEADGIVAFDLDGTVTEEIRELASELEIMAAVAYLNGVLTEKWGVCGISERLPETHSHARDALAAGLRLGQVLYLAYCAARDAVSWADRVSGDTRFIAQSAAVTTFGRYVQGALTQPRRALPSYRLPPQVPLPAAAPLVFAIVDHYDGAAAERAKIAEYARLTEMLGRQRYRYHPDGGRDCPYCDELDEHVHACDPLPYEQANEFRTDTGAMVDYALISPDATVTFHHGPREQLQQDAGHGLGAERLWLDLVPRLRAYVCELPGVPGCDCVRNIAGEQVLALLGGGAATHVGPIVIFQVAHSQAENALVSLDGEHQEIIETALRAATPYFLHVPGEEYKQKLRRRAGEQP